MKKDKIIGRSTWSAIQKECEKNYEGKSSCAPTFFSGNEWDNISKEECKFKWRKFKQKIKDFFKKDDGTLTGLG